MIFETSWTLQIVSEFGGVYSRRGKVEQESNEVKPSCICSVTVYPRCAIARNPTKNLPDSNERELNQRS
jgi:hypothetical protein